MMGFSSPLLIKNLVSRISVRDLFLELCVSIGGDPKTLIRVFDIPGAGISSSDIISGADRRLAGFESMILGLGGPFEAFDFPDSGFVLEPAESLDGRINLSTLRALSASMDSPDDGKSADFVRETIFHIAGICGMLGDSAPLLKNVRLVAGALALGTWGTTHEAPHVFKKRIAESFRKLVLEVSGAPESGPTDILFLSSVLSRVFEKGVLYGFGNLPEYFDAHGEIEKNLFAPRIVSDMRFLSKTVVGEMSEEEVAVSPGGTGASLLWLMAGNVPKSVEFWIPREVFERGASVQPDLRKKTPSGALISPLVSSADPDDAKIAEAVRLLSLFSTGFFDAVEFQATEAEARASSLPPVFLKCASFQENKDVTKKLSELSRRSEFGQELFHTVVLELLRTQEEAKNTEWLGKSVSSMLDESSGFFSSGMSVYLAPPSDVKLASFKYGDELPLALRIFEHAYTPGRMPFQNAVRWASLFRSQLFTETMSDEIRKGEAEPVRLFALSILDSILRFPFVENDTEKNPLLPQLEKERRTRKDARNALEAVTKGLSKMVNETDPNAAVRGLVEDAARMIRDYEESLPDKKTLRDIFADSGCSAEGEAEYAAEYFWKETNIASDIPNFG